MTTTEPERGRGNLLGPVIVVGLFAFFVADAAPSGPNAVATFFIAAAVVVGLFLVVVAVAVIIKRTRRPASSAVGALEVRPEGRRLVRASPKPPPAEDRPGAPGSDRYFLRAVDELLAAVDTLPDDQVEWIELDLLRFATSAAPAELDRLAGSGVASRLYQEVEKIVWLAERMTRPQLRYLSIVIAARRELR